MSETINNIFIQDFKVQKKDDLPHKLFLYFILTKWLDVLKSDILRDWQLSALYVYVYLHNFIIDQNFKAKLLKTTKTTKKVTTPPLNHFPLHMTVYEIVSCVCMHILSQSLILDPFSSQLPPHIGRQVQLAMQFALELPPSTSHVMDSQQAAMLPNIYMDPRIQTLVPLYLLGHFPSPTNGLYDNVKQ